MAPRPARNLRDAIVAAWRGDGAAARTQPILVASVCSGVLGYTVAQGLHVNVVLAYLLTVAVVFALTTAVLVYRDR